MTQAPRFMTWFRRGPLPRTVAHPVIVLGGTGLLREFLLFAATITEPGDLAIAAPFVRRGIASELRAWEAIAHDSMDLRLVTQNENDAAVALGELNRFPWRSLLIGAYPRLHAKLYYVSRARGGGACPVGSHNLTPSGALVNDEAGVLFVGGRNPEIERIVVACRDHIIGLSTRGNVVMDTLRLPRRVG